MRISVITTCLLALLIPKLSVSATLSGNDELSVYGVESTIWAYDNANVATYSGSDIAWYTGYDNSTLSVLDGEIGWVQLYDSATASIQGGNISWLKLYDAAESNLTSLSALSWLLVSDASIANIYGHDFSYQNGLLSGYWQDGTYFSFWALEEDNMISGSNSILPDNIVLHDVTVPEPSTLALLALGIAGIVVRTSIRSNKMAA